MKLDIVLSFKISLFFHLEHPVIAAHAVLNDLQEGFRSTISCTVVAGDLPMTITWQKDGMPLEHDPDRLVKHHSDFSSGGCHADDM